MKESAPREGMVVNRTALLSVAGEPVARVDGIMKPGGLLVHIRMGMFARGNSVLMLSAYALPGEDADNGRTFESHLQKLATLQPHLVGPDAELAGRRAAQATFFGLLVGVPLPFVVTERRRRRREAALRAARAKARAEGRPPPPERVAPS